MIEISKADTVRIRYREGLVQVFVDGKCFLQIADVKDFWIDNIAPKPKEHYTPSEAASFLGASINVFRNLVNRGEIPKGEIINGIQKYTKEQLEEIKRVL